MLLPKYPSSDDPRVKKTAKFLTEFFADLLDDRASFHAVALVQSLEWSEKLYHAGKQDRVALTQTGKALRKARTAASKISNWTVDALETEVHDTFVCQPVDPEASNPGNMPATLQEFDDVIVIWIGAVEAALDMHESWAPSHGKNVRAMVLIDEARRTWRSITDKPAPKKALNADPTFSRFRRFLDGVFESIDLSCDLSNAYENWAENAYDPDGQFDTPHDP